MNSFSFQEQKRYYLFLILLLLSFLSVAQGINASVSEKVYLQLSSTEFTINQTIWFKAIVTDSRTHEPTDLSGVLYVDLINQKGRIVSHKLLKLTNGIGYGFFDLNDGFKGRFLIRAYTQWNQNFGEDFVFNKYVNIYPLKKKQDEDMFSDLKTTLNEEGVPYLSGKITLQNDENTIRKKLPVILNWSSGKEEVLARKNGDNTYLLHAKIPNNLPWLELSAQTSQGFNASKTIILNGKSMDLQFFPESGKLVHGFQNRIGFKAVGFNGKGKRIEGAVFDNAGNKITNFESNALGMGVFYLKPNNNVSYYAKVFTNGEAADTTYMLPQTTYGGSILSVDKVKDKIRLRVVSNVLKDSAFVKASCRGVDYYLIRGALRKGGLISQLSSKDFPDGIIVFTLMDKKNKLIAERLFFNYSGKDELQVQVEMDKPKYVKREKTRLHIEVLDQEKGASISNASVMVLNKDLWRKGSDIKPYFLLQSELKGNIEDPQYYFEEDNLSRFRDLDALLLTQGWRNYKYPAKRQSAHFFWPEYGLTVKGRVDLSSLKNQNQKTVDLTLASFGRETALYTETSDSLGNFQFLLEDAHGKKMRALLHVNNGSKEKKNHKVSIANCPQPKVVYKHNPFAQKTDTITQVLLKKQERLVSVEAVLDSLYGVTQLDEVVVEDFRLTPERRKIYEKYGKPDVIIPGDSLLKKEKKWSYGLYSVLKFNYGSEIEIEEFSDGFMLAHIAGGHTLLMVDGRLLQKHEYEHVPNISLGIVESMELIKFAKHFKSRFLTVFPETNPLDAPYVGHIISINTKGKVGIHASNKPLPGTVETSIALFSPVKEFYSPKYDRPIPVAEQKPDLRSLIHWAPSNNTNENGIILEDFYNGDVPGDYVIIVEAISNDGRIGYQEKTFSVEE